MRLRRNDTWRRMRRKKGTWSFLLSDWSRHAGGHAYLYCCCCCCKQKSPFHDLISMPFYVRCTALRVKAIFKEHCYFFLLLCYWLHKKSFHVHDGLDSTYVYKEFYAFNEYEMRKWEETSLNGVMTIFWGNLGENAF